MADQTALSYADIGQGKPVLLLHGLGGSRQQWQDIVPTDLPVRRLLPDLPGHGQTDWLPVGGCTFGTFADAVFNTFSAFGPVSIVGISMGAGLAVRLALQSPDWVDKVMLVRPAWLDQPNPPNLAILHQLGTYWRDHSTEQTHKWLMDNELFCQLQHKNPACAESVVGQLKRPNPALAAQTLREMTAHAPVDTLADAYAMQVRAVVLGSANDPLHPFSMTRTWAEQLPNATFHEIPSRYQQPAEHLLHLQQHLCTFLGVG